MVGHLGVEPSDTALSGRPLRPAGSWPRKTEVSSPAAFRPPRVFKTRCRAGGASSKEESGTGERRSRPAAVTRPPVFGTGACHPAGSLSTVCSSAVWDASSSRRNRRKMVETIHMARGHHPLSKRGPPPGDFIFQARKAGDSNATVLPAHRLAGEPGTPVRFTFHFPVPFTFHVSAPCHPRTCVRPRSNTSGADASAVFS